MFCEHPWRALRHDKVRLQNEVLKGNRPKIRKQDENSADLPSDLIPLIKESWSAEPENRPSISSIKDRLYKILEPDQSNSIKSPSHRLINEYADSTITTKNSPILVDDTKEVSIEMTAVSSSVCSESSLSAVGSTAP